MKNGILAGVLMLLGAASAYAGYDPAGNMPEDRLGRDASGYTGITRCRDGEQVLVEEGTPSHMGDQRVLYVCRDGRFVRAN